MWEKEIKEMKLYSFIVLCKYCCLEKSKQVCENQVLLLEALADPEFDPKSEIECELVRFTYHLIHTLLIKFFLRYVFC